MEKELFKIQKRINKKNNNALYFLMSKNKMTTKTSKFWISAQ